MVAALAAADSRVAAPAAVGNCCQQPNSYNISLLTFTLMFGIVLHMINPNARPTATAEAELPIADRIGRFTVLPKVADNAERVVAATEDSSGQSLSEPAEPPKEWENPVFTKVAGQGDSIMSGALVVSGVADLLNKTVTAAGVERAPGTLFPAGELWHLITTNYSMFQRTLGEVMASGEGQLPATMAATGVAVMGMGIAVRGWRKRKAEKARQQEVLPPELLSETDKSILQ